jgi:hypothetical protein
MSKFIGNNQYSGLSVEDRFWQKVNKRDDDECWEWLDLAEPIEEEEKVPA